MHVARLQVRLRQVVRPRPPNAWAKLLKQFTACSQMGELLKQFTACSQMGELINAQPER